MKGIIRKNGMRDCLMFNDEILWPLPCSYPEKEECGGYMKPIQRSKDLRIGITLCKYRCKEIGRRNCIREQLQLKDSAKHSK